MSTKDEPRPSKPRSRIHKLSAFAVGLVGVGAGITTISDGRLWLFLEPGSRPPQASAALRPDPRGSLHQAGVPQIDPRVLTDTTATPIDIDSWCASFRRGSHAVPPAAGKADAALEWTCSDGTHVSLQTVCDDERPGSAAVVGNLRDQTSARCRL